jgi:uncharacterized membrane protein YwzB
MLVLIQTSLIILAFALLIRLIVDPEYNKLGGIIASLILPFLPNIARKLFKAEMSFRLQLTYYIFLFAALFLGINFDFYKTVPHFDKLMHLISGVLSVIIAWYALRFFKADSTSKPFQAVFIICFCVAIAVAWEFFEFGCDKLLGQNMQQLVSEGVDDTMFDLIAATIGACIGTMILMSRTKSVAKFALEDREPRKKKKSRS